MLAPMMDSAKHVSQALCLNLPTSNSMGVVKMPLVAAVVGRRVMAITMDTQQWNLPWSRSSKFKEWSSDSFPNTYTRCPAKRLEIRDLGIFLFSSVCSFGKSVGAVSVNRAEMGVNSICTTDDTLALISHA